MSENTTVRVYFLTSIDVELNETVNPDDLTAISAALVQIDLPRDITVVGYDVIQNPAEIETFYWDSDFRLLVEAGAVEPFFDIKDNLQTLKELLGV